ncbi:MAG: integration host factor subunit alpha [Telluria sp.]
MGFPDCAIGFSSSDGFIAKSALARGFARASAAAEVPQDGGAAESSTLTKAELSERLFEHVGLNKREAKDMVEAFFDEISDALVRGELVKLMGFGNFQLRDKGSRPGRNPKSGAEVQILARRVVAFQASPEAQGHA